MLPTERKSYRADIDGLRALAVLPVLLYHAGIPGLGGGFVGVDVFFVISGFLITGILAREIAAGEFSLIAFYERRARRILPALFAVIAFVLIGASLIYLPGDFEGVPPSALAALLFSANLWFFTQTGYFQGGAETMPLLHTWSLGVEEQFYIFFPPILWLIARYARSWQNVLIILAALGSFALAWMTQGDRSGMGFYMLPMRAWELLAGSILALGIIAPVRQRWLREGLSLAGLLAILGPVALYTHDTVFPGLTALPPVMGAALLIHCAPGTRIGSLLSNPAPVFIGMISYSLYLWHWPLIVFTQYWQDAPLSPLQSLVIIALSILVAWVSWRFIEAPFRSTKGFNRKRIFTWSAGGMAALGAVALAMVSLGGWPSRFSDDSVRLAAAGQDFSPRRADCASTAIETMRAKCNLGADAAPEALLWGDSHGVEMAWALGQSYARNGRALAQRTRGSCPPIADWHDPQDTACSRFNAEVLAEIEGSTTLKRVYLAGYWESTRYRSSKVADGIEHTIARIQAAGKQVVFIAPVPSQPFDVPRKLAQIAARGGNVEQQASKPLSAHEAGTHWVRSRFPAWRERGVLILDPLKALGQGASTRIVKDGEPLYFDSHHLSVAGARLVVEANRDI